jgi:hypothetical protein
MRRFASHTADVYARVSEDRVVWVLWQPDRGSFLAVSYRGREMRAVVEITAEELQKIEMAGLDNLDAYVDLLLDREERSRWQRA